MAVPPRRVLGATADLGGAGGIPAAAARGSSWIWVVLVLALCHAAAVASFQVLSVLVGPLKAALSLTDVQYSLMQGLAVAIFASLLGIPAATVADRGNRRLIVLVGVAAWSLATVGCALAQTFGELFTARMFVGLGEVFLYPAALSMIADVAPPGRLSSAIGAFGCGGPMGAALALMGGGWLVRAGDRFSTALPGLEPWRLVFLLCGAFGVIAGILLLTVSEPDHRASRESGPAGIHAALRHILQNWRVFAGVSGGMLALSFCVYATASWLPAMLVRDHGMSYGSAGATTGAAALGGGALGAWVSGLLSDRVESAGRRDGSLQVAVGVAGAFVVAIPAAVLVSSWWGTVASVWVGYTLLGMPTVLGGTALQQISPPRMRAQVMALQVLLVNLLALSLGPLTVAVLSEHVFGSARAVGYGLALTVGAGALAAAGAFLLSRKAFCGYRNAADLERCG
ncbi:MAG TPA: MFS transporter [Steroidobacteraceae bacterium]|nr:MFS transporter [Steroidobacteraceae bacterium]